jgi:hypothetical protein
VFLKVEARNLGIRFYANKLEAYFLSICIQYFKCGADTGRIMHGVAYWQENSAVAS